MSWSARQLEMLERMALGPVWTSRLVTPLQEEQQQAAAEVQAPADAQAAPADATIALAASPSVIVPLQPATPAIQPAPGATWNDWPELEQAVSACVACGLCQGRHKTVFGVGDPKATWLFVGEGPGRQEDMQGEPFVGPAGKLLDNMLKALDLSRTSNAFIANIVKCRPTADDGRDRPPTQQEIEACLPFLQRQIALLQPDVIVALGRIAAVSLLGLPPDTSVGSLRGKLHSYQGKPLVVTYHPAYLLRQPADKARVWRDLCMARAAHERS